MAERGIIKVTGGILGGQKENRERKIKKIFLALDSRENGTKTGAKSPPGLSFRPSEIEEVFFSFAFPCPRGIVGGVSLIGKVPVA